MFTARIYVCCLNSTLNKFKLSSFVNLIASFVVGSLPGDQILVQELVLLSLVQTVAGEDIIKIVTQSVELLFFSVTESLSLLHLLNKFLEEILVVFGEVSLFLGFISVLSTGVEVHGGNLGSHEDGSLHGEHALSKFVGNHIY